MAVCSVTRVCFYGFVAPEHRAMGTFVGYTVFVIICVCARACVCVCLSACLCEAKRVEMNGSL